MSRVDAAELAVRKAQEEETTEGAAAASDAFFPFRDGLDVLAQAGVKAVVQPGGSKRDAEVIAAADEHGRGDAADRDEGTSGIEARRTSERRILGLKSQATGSRPAWVVGRHILAGSAIRLMKLHTARFSEPPAR